MEEQEIYYTDLICRYFSSEIDAENLEKLKQWVLQNEENKRIFQEHAKLFQAINKTRVARIDVQQAYSDIPWTAIDVPHTKIKANTKSSIFQFRWAAALLIFLLSTAIIYWVIPKESVFRQIATTSCKDVLLPDGSQVTLQKGSEIEYTSKFHDNREVKLKGTAYFTVIHDANHPFKVITHHLNITDLGTSFLVKEAAQSTKVVLTDGKLALASTVKPANLAYLFPGEKAEILSGSDQIRTCRNTELNYMAFKTAKLVFENTELTDVIKDLEIFYSCKMALADKHTGRLRLTATFDHQTLESVIKVLESTLRLKIHSSNSIYEISEELAR